MGSTEVIYKTRVLFTINDFTKTLSDNKDRSDSKEEDNDSQSDDEDNNEVVSDTIFIGSDYWKVMVHLKDNDDEEYLSVYLKLLLSSDDTVDAAYEVYVRDIDGHPLSIEGLDRHEFTSEETSWGLELVKRSLLLDQKDKYLPNDSLTLVFGITVYKPTIGPKRRRLFANSFNNKDLNDCRLVIKGQEFFASKVILSDRSEVFYNMFTTDMSEKTTSDVVIDDIDYNVFEKFYRFLCNGDSENIEDFAEDLLYVSDKYMVSELKTICENLFYLKLSPKNAFKVLELLDKYGNQVLVKKCLQYIRSYWNQCLETEWYKLVGNDKKLIGKVIDAMKSGSNNKTETKSYTYTPGVLNL